MKKGGTAYAVPPFLSQLHLLYPQERQDTQPPSCSSGWPHSGQNLAVFSAAGGMSTAFCAFSGVMTDPPGVWPAPIISLTFLTTRAIASGQEVQLIPSRRKVYGQRIPRSCSRILSIETPERNAMDTSRAVASDCEGQPPALPVEVNTSQMPFSS